MIYLLTPSQSNLIYWNYSLIRFLINFNFLIFADSLYYHSFWHVQIDSRYHKIELLILIELWGYIDVGDGCWRRNLLVTTITVCDSVGDILVTNIHYLFKLTSGINIQKMSPNSKFNNTNKSSPILSRQHLDVTNLWNLTII